MSTRKHMRRMAKARMRRDGVERINRHVKRNWRNIMGAYPGFVGEKRQKSGTKQPILVYPAHR